MSFSRRTALGLVIGLLLTFGAFPFSTTRAAGSIVVNDSSDTPHRAGCAATGTGKCTLRDAITYANANAGDDTITFSGGFVITLGSPLPSINDTLTIDGATQVTVDGATNYSIFTVNQSAALNLAAITLQNASCSDASCGDGAAIRNNGGTVTVTNSTFSNNVTDEGNGGAIGNDNDGTLTVNNSTFSGNAATGGYGGAIASDSGTLTVSGSTLTDNSTAAYKHGGAIAVTGGTATVTTSTFSNNIANSGGAIYVTGTTLVVKQSTFNKNTTRDLGWGGGIYNNAGTTNVTNSTFYANWAEFGGAMYNDSGTLNVTNSTVANNTGWNQGGGIYNDGTSATLRNTIVAGNSKHDCDDYSNTMTADSFNLDTDGSCADASEKTVEQIALGPLKKNGGPTRTMALGAGSEALDRGTNNVCPATDQRGITRPQGLLCDVGAYESNTQFGPNFVVNVTADNDDGECSTYVSGITDCTLREAISAANANGGSDTITFKIGKSIGGCTAANQCTLTLGSVLPKVTGDLTIDGSANNGKITLVGPAGAQLITVNMKRSLYWNQLTLVNGACDSCDYGGIINNGTLNVTNSTFTGVQSIGNAGGGVTNFGTATVVNSTFSANSSTIYFGAIYNGPNAVLMVVNSTLAKNGNYGVSADGGTVTLRNTIVAGNAQGDCTGQKSAYHADKFNLDGDGSCNAATKKTPAQLALGPLHDNGGATLTIKPGAGSAALDAGDNDYCPPTDQRGVKRPQGPNCDVGAVEVRVK